MQVRNETEIRKVNCKIQINKEIIKLCEKQF